MKYITVNLIKESILDKNDKLFINCNHLIDKNNIHILLVTDEGFINKDQLFGLKKIAYSKLHDNLLCYTESTINSEKYPKNNVYIDMEKLLNGYYDSLSMNI